MIIIFCCPQCGDLVAFEHDASHLNLNFDFDEMEIKCQHCGKKLCVECEVSIAYE